MTKTKKNTTRTSRTYGDVHSTPPQPNSLAEIADRLREMGLKPRQVKEIIDRIRNYGTAVLKRYLGFQYF